MKKKTSKYSAFFEPRVFIAFLLLFGASLLAITGFGTAEAQAPKSAAITAAPSAPALQSQAAPDVVRLVGPFSEDRDLNTLPYIRPNEEEEGEIRSRYPFPRPGGINRAPDFVTKTVDSVLRPQPAIPSPLFTFEGMDSNLACGTCLPPDTHGDVGPNHYIQSVNSSIRIHDKAGNVLAGPISYNSFFSSIGTGNPCGNNNNGGDGVIVYVHISNRWVVSDFAFPAFPGTSFWQCIGVSKTADPVTGGWWLYSVQVDPANTNYLGDYPKLALWPDAYYLTMNEFSNNTTFNGTRIYALDRASMINGAPA